MSVRRLSFGKILAVAGLLILVGAVLVGFRSVRLKTGWEVFEEVQVVAKKTSGALYYSMVSINAKGEVLSGKAVMFFDMGPEESKMILHITEPAEWAGISLLVNQGVNRADGVFLHRPGLAKPEAITGRLLQNYLLTMNWSYMDFLYETKDSETYARLGDGELDGVECYQVTAKPATDARRQISGYGERRFWVSKEENVVLKVNFLNQQGRLLKTARMMDFQVVGPTQTSPKQASRIEMTHHLRNLSETYVITGIRPNIDFPENFFSPETLPDRDWEAFFATLNQQESVN